MLVIQIEKSLDRNGSSCVSQVVRPRGERTGRGLSARVSAHVPFGLQQQRETGPFEPKS